MPITTAVLVYSIPCGPSVNADTTQPTAVARAVLEQGRYSWIWVVPACPYCGKQHDHYGGLLDGDPYRHAGCVVPARCDNVDRKRFVPAASIGDLRYVLEPDEQKVLPVRWTLV